MIEVNILKFKQYFSGFGQELYNIVQISMNALTGWKQFEEEGKEGLLLQFQLQHELELRRGRPDEINSWTDERWLKEKDFDQIVAILNKHHKVNTWSVGSGDDNEMVAHKEV